MTIPQLKERYINAHNAYLEYRYTNKTNNTEAQFMPEAIAFLKEYHPQSRFIVNNDNFLNYCGCDIIEVSADNKVFIWDLKVCKYYKDFNVLCDGWKHSSDNILYYKATDVKLNDFFLFINADNFIVLPFDTVENNIPPKEDCFFMRRDLYKTTSKFVLDTKYFRKYYKERKKYD